MITLASRAESLKNQEQTLRVFGHSAVAATALLESRIEAQGGGQGAARELAQGQGQGQGQQQEQSQGKGDARPDSGFAALASPGGANASNGTFNGSSSNGPNVNVSRATVELGFLAALDGDLQRAEAEIRAVAAERLAAEAEHATLQAEEERGFAMVRLRDTAGR